MSKEKPDVKRTIEELKKDNPVFKVKESQYHLELGQSDFNSTNEYKRFIKNVVRLVRSSTGYKNWVRYLKDEMDINTCALTDEVASEVTIDIHHHPISLTNICTIVVDTLMAYKEKFTEFDVADLVVKLHFAGKVGFIPLIRSLHEKYHNGFLQIPIELVRGDWQFLLDEGWNVSADIRIVVDKLTDIHLKDVGETWKRNAYLLDDEGKKLLNHGMKAGDG